MRGEPFGWWSLSLAWVRHYCSGSLMRAPRLVLIGVLFLAAFAEGADRGWTPLWNGKNLDGWTTWMREPALTSHVPGLKRDADGTYKEPIGSGRDPLRVFTVVDDVDGR